MKRIFTLLLLIAALFGTTVDADAQAWLRLLSGGVKAYQAYTISDSEVQQYVHQYITQLDKQSNVLPESNAYTRRLRNLTNGLTSVDGIRLNFMVYKTKEVNAFACADGSVRVYTGLMDLMTDDEILGVIGHEVGHVAHKDTKEAFKKALLTSAMMDGLGATSSKVAVFTDSQLGSLTEAMLNARFSRKQEEKADDYGYEFLVKSHKNPWAMALAFEKLQKMEGTSSSAAKFVSNLFSDHPDTQKRIKRMADRATRDGYARPKTATKKK